MAEIKTVTSPQNGAYRQTAKYVQSKEARKDKVFLVEGVRAVEEVLRAPDWVTRSLWLGESLQKSNPGFYRRVRESAGCPVYSVSDDMMKRLSDTETPQGVVAVVERRSFKVAEVLLQAAAQQAAAQQAGEKDGVRRSPLLLILENLQDPGNVGTLLRTADAAGATALIVTRGTADIYSSKVVRAAMGSLLHVPVCLAESVPPLAEALIKARFTVLAAALTDASVVPYDVDMTGPLAIVIGNEGNGLTEETLRAASQTVRIPMEGKAESLNAAMAGGILLYEAVRQRR